MAKFEDPRLSMLNAEDRHIDDGMRKALLEAMEPSETAVASYSVSAHIWVEAVLTDRALLIVKGAVRARTHRVPLPLEITRRPTEMRQGARVRTPLGRKTLWGSALDPDMTLLTSAGSVPGTAPTAPTPAKAERLTNSRPSVPEDSTSERPESLRLTRRQRAEARKQAGKKPRKPRRQRAKREWVGFAPSSTIWDISYNCIKCGRALTNPNSQRHRVGTDCIKRYGSQARKIANPAHSEWTARKSKAEVDRIAQQVRYDAEHARAMDAYDTAIQQWKAIRSGLLVPALDATRC